MYVLVVVATVRKYSTCHKKETLTDSDEMYFNSAHINMHDSSSRQSML